MTPEAAQKIVKLLGLGARGRLVVVGAEQVRAAAKKGKLSLAVVASDASENSRDKVLSVLKAKNIRAIEGISAAQLGAAFGRESTAAVGVLDADLARGIQKAAHESTAGKIV
ncbi:MAG: ribosomal L7Ae/L30e/S12e/Gadd45 family protein [Gemmatimonadaceae bacterium]|nr:ribosomal L7Ae/L30e/S12e/Gadd45 family protein [Gemmatimonadaceae bacterium]